MTNREAYNLLELAITAAINALDIFLEDADFRDWAEIRKAEYKEALEIAEKSLYGNVW